MKTLYNKQEVLSYCMTFSLRGILNAINLDSGRLKYDNEILLFKKFSMFRLGRSFLSKIMFLILVVIHKFVSSL